jgi:hypothetical protein
VLVPQGARALYVAKAMQAELTARRFDDWETWHRALAAGVGSSGRGVTAIVAGATGPRWRLKRLLRGGGLARIWGDRYPSARRPVGMLAVSEEVFQKGIPTARPVALLIESGFGGLTRGAMAFEEIEGSVDLARRARQGSITQAELVAAIDAVRSMHDRGVHHVDLNLGNILLRPRAGGPPEALLIDFDRAVVGSGPRPFGDRQAALRRLERSCAKLTGEPGPLGAGTEDLWYTIYAGDNAGLARSFARGRAAGRLLLAVHRMGWRRNKP